ncbi:tetrahydrodipicolinate N-succinyltransferase [Buchnera aphidicola (Nipponaphis monzeni)]|uniref:2,3,4,5-tetrahydropyridine-2,6-dicarboxylate N-succinyltransferase n=1 Tax=Buchnera aphidicola (Nipponaphis monzeni) TaxID=2495405 RepID=A0A455TA30_9GAMM|nr:2,3,4,5-tetrahydropyridine-2,6-dicarboxylate N-succinyltransferase [Buchnera aphidicola]BBI01194.1 tetrahydrodipicolinate N-succinyltransferase [Buchnera aphidicola (Nipponaphis monzeni)]
MKTLEKQIKIIFEQKETIHLDNIDPEHKSTIEKTIQMLNEGKLKISEKINGQWTTHQWLKKAILLYYMISENNIIHGLETTYYDKIKLKYSDYSEEEFKKDKVRIVPQATVRYGSFISENSVLMPCYVNIGAHIGKNSMIDTWATIGSCAQIGNNVHISGGAGIGGVLEPLQSNPTIIEDNCFIGARSEIVEGVIIEENCVISMGVFIGQSTKIYNRNTGTIHYGKVPKKSVVVPGYLPSKNNSHGLYCAVIVKEIDSQTLSKIEINKILREYN